MANTVLNQLRSVFSPAVARDLASTTGEQNAAVQKALDGLLPTLVSGVANRTATDEGAQTLVRLLKTTPFATDSSAEQLVETDSHRQKAADSGNDLLRQLFPDRPQRLAEATAQYAGLKPASATTITGVVMSVLMGFLHKQLTTRNLNDSQLVALLRDDAGGVRGAIPAALAGVLGWFLGGDRAPATPVGNVTTRTDDDDKGGFPWLRWLLLALGLALLFWLITRTCTNRDGTAAITDTTSQSTTVSADTIASDLDGNEMATDSANGPEVRVAVDLPGGRKLNVAENSFNYQLAQFLAQKGGKLPRVFTFDNLTFETNSAQITAKARPNVDDLIQIMQSYPSLTIRVEGHTDSTGPDALNDPLSAERAQMVKSELVKAGIDAGRVTTRDLGEDKPVASNATETGREKNRRIDVVVTKL